MYILYGVRMISITYVILGVLGYWGYWGGCPDFLLTPKWRGQEDFVEKCLNIRFNPNGRA